MPKPLCHFFPRGTCRNGVKCKFKHPTPALVAPAPAPAPAFRFDAPELVPAPALVAPVAPAPAPGLAVPGPDPAPVLAIGSATGPASASNPTDPFYRDRDRDNKMKWRHPTGTINNVGEYLRRLFENPQDPEVNHILMFLLIVNAIKTPDKGKTFFIPLHTFSTEFFEKLGQPIVYGRPYKYIHYNSDRYCEYYKESSNKKGYLLPMECLPALRYSYEFLVLRKNDKAPFYGLIWPGSKLESSLLYRYGIKTLGGFMSKDRRLIHSLVHRNIIYFLICIRQRSLYSVFRIRPLMSVFSFLGISYKNVL